MKQQKLSSNLLTADIFKRISTKVSDFLGSLLVEAKSVEMSQCLTVRQALNELVILITCVKEHRGFYAGPEEYLVYLCIINFDKIDEIDIPL
jgi:hypothetical protein